MLKFFHKLWQRVGDSSVITKITLLYLLAIFIPSMSMAILGYRQGKLSAEENVINTHGRIFDEVYSDLTQALKGAEVIGDQLSFNADLRNFLSRPFESTSDSVLEYTRQISPIAVYAQRFQGGDIDGVRVFYENDTIPELWVYFYFESRLLKSEWYLDFKQSEKNSMWVYPNVSGFHSDSLDINSYPVISYARKIYNPQRRHIGSIVVDLRESRIQEKLGRFTSTAECFGIYDSQGQILISSCSPEDNAVTALPSSLRESMPENSIQRIRFDNFMYFAKALPIGDLALVHKVDVGEEIRRTLLYQLLTVLVFIGAILMLEAIAFFGLRVFFKRLRRITSAMNRAAEGDFQIRIPVKRRDEIGQITEDFNKMIKKVQFLVDENVRRETAQKNAQLTALQFQLNPHFLYNMIDTFRMKLVMEDTHEIADSLAHFGKMLRYNISAENQYATLGDEITYVKQYHSIQQLRYEGRVTLATSIPETDYETTILRFILQPIVENSIKHGMRDEESTLHIEIHGKRVEHLYEITVRDNGQGIDKGKMSRLNAALSHQQDIDNEIQQTGEGIGLTNISERLHLFYGDDAHITLESEKDVFTQVSMIIPFSLRK